MCCPGVSAESLSVFLSILFSDFPKWTSQFSSKYDAYLAGEVTLSEEEEWGLELFNGKGMCSECHPSEKGPGGEPPLFTDFTFDNLGTPKSPDNPFYKMTRYSWRMDLL